MSLLSSLGKIVTIINRVIDADGKRVPYEAYIDGTVIKIEDSYPIQEGLARIIVHNSMYCIDPDTYTGQYKLAVKEWGMPSEDLPLAEIKDRVELINREQLPPNRQFGAVDQKTGRKYQTFYKKQAIRRHDPIKVVGPGANEDGAHPGGFGEAFAR